MNHQHKAQLKSIVSSIAALITAVRGPDVIVGLDSRVKIESDVMDIIESFQPDNNSWSNPAISSKYFYDVYLAIRLEAGEQTELDLIRPELTVANFTDNMEYHRHCLRIGEYKTKTGNELGMKVCNSCGDNKSTRHFKRGGSAKCFSCLGKEYRARKAAERGEA